LVGRISQLSVELAAIRKWHGQPAGRTARAKAGIARGPKKPPDMAKMSMPHQTTDNREVRIRVHFYWDSASLKIIIGHCGEHLPL
jgi:hypothetical protein